MKTLNVLFLLAILGLSTQTALADDQLPVCAANGDKDGDGVPDAQDQTDDDSCTSTHTGFEDCATGAGDGLPDCQ